MRIALLFALLGVMGLHAEEPFSFAKAPGRLPKDVVPKHYAIQLEPDLTASTFRGSETITIEVRQPVRKIVLNSLDLEITSARVHPASSNTATAPIKPLIDPTAQTLTLPLESELAPGDYRVDLEFSGKLGEQTYGLYVTRYQSEAGEGRALATQMEPADCRRMFPCWDEPAFRAIFQLSVTVPTNHTPVSNMPAEKETPVEGGKKQVSFAPTPSMASYLMALFSGEFEALEDTAEGVKLRVLTTPGKREQARYALDSTKKILAYFNEYFGTRYPLPKLDQVAIPSTGASAMENWGAIVYNDTAFLYDPQTSSQSTKERVFSIIAHEIAHQWFGNLVTMGWWDNLWLNEGFASWMGTKATDRLNPEWQVWLRAAGDKEWAMWLDARSTSHPIQQPVHNESQALDAFDAITYSKGQAFLRMLESYLGEVPFQGGIQAYMKKHAYGNTTTADLWKALEEASGKPVTALAGGWTEQSGFPVVKLRLQDERTIEMVQERFTINQTKPEPLFWAVPVKLGPSAAPLDARLILLKDTRPVTAPIDPNEAVKGNLGDTGYFRVSYDDTLFQRLLNTIPHMAVADRLNLLNDSWALALAGRVPVTRYFQVVEAVAGMPDYALLDQIIDAFGFIDQLQHGRPGEKVFHAWGIRLLAPHLARLGWDPAPGEKQLDALLRAALVERLGKFGDEGVLREARTRYERFLENPATLSGDLRGPVLTLIGRQADAATWEKLAALARAETSTEQKRSLYRALASAQSPELATRTLALSLTDELIPRQAVHLLNQVGTEGDQPALALEFAKANLDALLTKVPAMSANEYVPSLYRPFMEEARAVELEQFAKEKLPPATAYQVSRAADEVRFKAALLPTLLPDIDEWCRARPGN